MHYFCCGNKLNVFFAQSCFDCCCQKEQNRFIKIRGKKKRRNGQTSSRPRNGRKSLKLFNGSLGLRLNLFLYIKLFHGINNYYRKLEMNLLISSESSLPNHKFERHLPLRELDFPFS